METDTCDTVSGSAPPQARTSESRNAHEEAQEHAALVLRLVASAGLASDELRGLLECGGLGLHYTSSVSNSAATTDQSA